MPNILLVDDEIENLKSLKLYLEDQSPDWNILIAQTESEFKTILNEQSPDVVISDLVMATEQSGLHILSQTKAKDPLIMVILITAYEKKLNRYEAFKLGAFDCVQKNTPGLIAAEEIFFKAKAALHFRELAQDRLENQTRISFMRRYFDPRVFDIIESTPDLLNVRNQMVTICFWDIRGFSLLSEILKASPTLISGFLQEYFQAAAEVIFEHNGVLDKFIGDGIMGLFGSLNQKDKDGRGDAVDAIRASLALRGRFEQILAKWHEEWSLYVANTIDIGLGCGIHTGEALVGNVGTAIRDQFTALGPQVNLAQRIEARSLRGQILISSSTYTRVKKAFKVEDAGIIKDIKNIPGEFQLYSVL
jgi:adenylate cyclase